MSQPAIITRLEQQLGITIAPSDAPDLNAFMRYGRKEEDKSQYWLKDGTLTGLKLRTLGLQDTSFLKAPELSGLQGLYLAENDFSSLHLPASLQQLQLLNLADNKALQTLEFAGAMPQLEEIDLSDSGIQALHLPDCQALQKLDASRSRLKAFSFASAFPKLWWLDLSGNEGLSSLELPNGFEALQYLYLYKSGIQELQIGGKLPKLIVLDLEGNQLKQWPEKFLLPEGLETLYLEGNPIENIPETTRGSGERHNSAEDVRLYLESIKDQTKVSYLHQAKMILVGNGEVGKSSIRIKLLDESAPLPEPGPNGRTPGLEISITPYTVKQLEPEITGLDEAIDFQLNIWDFGGQSKYREVQQLLCSPKSLYLFVTSVDDTPETKENYVNFDYWLRMVRTLSLEEGKAQGSPVIHVTNKIDLGNKNINEKDRNQLKNIAAFLKISCEEDLTNFDSLRKQIRKTLDQVGDGIFRDRFNNNWLEVKATLEARRDENHITYDAYRAIYDPMLTDEEAASWLRTLSNIGAVIYFGKHEKLKDWIILNPNWVTEAVFKVIDSGLSSPVKKESFSKLIWQNYSDAEIDHLLYLMEAYDLCYPLQDDFGNEILVVPALLSEEAPNLEPYGFDIYDKSKLRVKYDPFLPAGTVNKLIVRLRKHLFRGLIWKDNVILHDPASNTYAHVQEDWRSRSVYIDLLSHNKSAASHLYQLITSALSNLNRNFKETKFIQQLDYTIEGNVSDKWVALDILEELSHSDYAFCWKEQHTLQREKTVLTNELTDTTIMEKIRLLVANAQLAAALKGLQDIVSGTYQDEVTNLTNRLNKFQREKRMGLLRSEEENVQYNQISNAILELAGRIEGGEAELSLRNEADNTPSKNKVLFICSSSDGQNPLDFGAAFREIEDARQRANRREDFDEVDIKTSVQRRRLVRILTDIKPNVLHISLHSSKSKGLYFEGRAGEVAPINPSNFRENIRTYLSHPDAGDKFDVVILDACNSLKHGKAILEFTDYVVCTQDFFPDEAGRDYAEEFYSHFFNGHPVEFCHDAGINLIRDEGYEQPEGVSMPVHEILTLLKRQQ
ncbi:MAG: hypothetical protein GVY26_07380 [Bacteroidetes bacterium]|jgi:Leucine-rich repeat (LRR) protein|nr:hypothetical protein [Bacteroidota bacterium]